MQAQETASGSRKAKNSGAAQSEDTTKSISSVIGENLTDDAKKQIEVLGQTFSQATTALNSTRTFVSSNRGEAIAIVAAVGAVAWAVLYTKPGRQLFDALAPKVVPMVSDKLIEAVRPLTEGQTQA